MSHPFDFFSEIYCVNLDTRPDRWHESESEFDKIGIRTKVTRFSGIVFPESSGPMRGRAGCASSIRQIVKQAKEKKLENVLILEDDVTFVEGTNKVLETSLKDLSNFDWRMFYLGASVRDEFSETPLVKVTDNLLRMVGGQCTHAFACHNSIYDEVLDGIGDIDRIIPWLYGNEAIDKWIAKNIQTNHDVYCTNPIIATQRPCWSDIDSKQADFGQELIDRFNSFLK